MTSFHKKNTPQGEIEVYYFIKIKYWEGFHNVIILRTKPIWFCRDVKFGTRGTKMNFLLRKNNGYKIELFILPARETWELRNVCKNTWNFQSIPEFGKRKIRAYLNTKVHSNQAYWISCVTNLISLFEKKVFKITLQ